MPLGDHLKIEHQLNLALAKNKTLVERERTWIQVKSQRDNELNKLQETQTTAHDLEVKLAEAGTTACYIPK